MVGKLYEYLVVSPPRTYPEFYQEVKDLLLLAARDFPDFEYHEGLVENWGDILMWFGKWFDGIIPSSIEKVTEE